MISIFAYLLAAIAPMDSGSIASKSASYDGSVLILDGDVSLEHGFGKMKAEKAVLTHEQKGQAEFPFTTIDLAEAVHLSLSTDAQIDCERATLDFSTMKGILTSPQNVHYVDKINLTPFELFSPHLDLQMMKNAEKKESYDIEKAYAQNGVHLIYDQVYHLNTESILFANDHIRSDGDACTWTYQNDRVDAEKFDLELSQNHLHLMKAAGHMSSFLKGEVNFTADDLYWKHTENHLVLKGTPKVQETSLGTIDSSQEIDLILKEQKLDKLKTLGSTTLTSHKGHILKTEGPLEIDSEKSLAIIHPHPTQLLYQEEEMTLAANEAQIFYREDEQGLHPEKIELQGKIKIFSQEKEGPARRGIADTLTYHPDTRTCILKADPGQKVLFMRDQDQLRISANEVHITYNPATQEQEVRGIGHVVLSLSPEEQNLLNQVFRHEPSTP
ncbi:MAG: hypothetical protein KBA81_02390 [Rhabdochlamydiaceae bacterium]|nr:hypothetical protein [Rhabdochlamydiaceae bacterium]